jgi:hypothetical protein
MIELNKVVDVSKCREFAVLSGLKDAQKFVAVCILKRHYLLCPHNEEVVEPAYAVIIYGS